MLIIGSLVYEAAEDDALEVLFFLEANQTFLKDSIYE